jgi:hypothetical protein
MQMVSKRTALTPSLVSTLAIISGCLQLATALRNFSSADQELVHLDRHGIAGVLGYATNTSQSSRPNPTCSYDSKKCKAAYKKCKAEEHDGNNDAKNVGCKAFKSSGSYPKCEKQCKSEYPDSQADRRTCRKGCKLMVGISRADCHEGNYCRDDEASSNSNTEDDGFEGVKVPSELKACEVKPCESLLPELVPPPGIWYTFGLNEQTGFADFMGIDRGKYTLVFEEAKIGRHGKQSQGKAKKFFEEVAKAEGKGTIASSMVGWYKKQWFGNINPDDGKMMTPPLFLVKQARIFTFRDPYVIYAGEGKGAKPDDALYTINRDIMGAKYLFFGDQWHIYNGRKRDQKELYYGTSPDMSSALTDAFGLWTEIAFWKSKADYKEKKDPVAYVKQKRNAGAFLSMSWIPDQYKIEVGPGEDTGALLAIAMIMDVVTDSNQEQGMYDTGNGMDLLFA